MTTDTFAKVATATATIGATTVTINGIAKGAGMIAPDMATMLSFVFTDAPIAAAALQAMLKDGGEPTPSTPSPLTVTPPPPIPCWLSPPVPLPRDGAPKIGKANDAVGSRPSARLSRQCWPTSPSRSRATARAPASWSRSWSKARSRRNRRAASRCRSPIPRWSRPRSPARTPTGAGSSWRSARPASPPIATSCRFGSVASALRTRARAILATTRPRFLLR